MREEDGRRVGYHLGGAARTPACPNPTPSSTSPARRRARALARLRDRLRGEPSDVNVILPFEEVVAALGRRGERQLGQQVIPLDSIVGTVDRGREFDRSFRPTSGKVRTRWERVAAAQRRGEAMPPIDVYRIGELHFVKDGHHRVSVARALGHKDINAYVTEVLTEVGAEREITLADLPLKSHERLFRERVPLPEEARATIQLSDEWRYAALAEAVEAWGFRREQATGEELSRPDVAEAWFREEYEPVVEMLQEAGLARKGTATEAYMRVSHLRYLILRTHDWDDERDRAPARGARAPQLGRGHDGEGAAEGAALAALRGVAAARGGRVRCHRRSGCGRPPGRTGGAGRRPPRSRPPGPPAPCSRGRSAPRSCRARRSSAPRRRRRPRPARAAPATRCPGRVSTVKWAYSSEPIDSTTSIRARNVEPRCFTSSVTTAASSKFSGRMPAISCLPAT